MQYVGVLESTVAQVIVSALVLALTVGSQGLWRHIHYNQFSRTQNLKPVRFIETRFAAVEYHCMHHIKKSLRLNEHLPIFC